MNSPVVPPVFEAPLPSMHCPWVVHSFPSPHCSSLLQSTAQVLSELQYKPSAQLNVSTQDFPHSGPNCTQSSLSPQPSQAVANINAETKSAWRERIRIEPPSGIVASEPCLPMSSFQLTGGAP